MMALDGYFVKIRDNIPSVPADLKTEISLLLPLILASLVIPNLLKFTY